MHLHDDFCSFRNLDEPFDVCGRNGGRNDSSRVATWIWKLLGHTKYSLPNDWQALVTNAFTNTGNHGHMIKPSPYWQKEMTEKLVRVFDGRARNVALHVKEVSPGKLEIHSGYPNPLLCSWRLPESLEKNQEFNDALRESRLLLLQKRGDWCYMSRITNGGITLNEFLRKVKRGEIVPLSDDENDDGPLCKICGMSERRNRKSGPDGKLAHHCRMTAT